MLNRALELAPPAKRKRNLPGTPDPDAEVIALSPRTLLATNRFVCEICGKGFQRDQNLQLHRRGHSLPWKLRQRSGKEPRKRVYVCPEKTCVHHNPSRALGDLTGIKKHFCRKHGEKKWKCDKCNKRYAVQSDWKAHSKTCGTREYRCDCGTLFSRRDSFVTHRAFCDALAEETARLNNQRQNHHPYLLAAASSSTTPPASISLMPSMGHIANVLAGAGEPTVPSPQLPLTTWQFDSTSSLQQLGWLYDGNNNVRKLSISKDVPSLFSSQQHANPAAPAPDMSATALLLKATQIGAVTSSVVGTCFEPSRASSHRQQNSRLGNVPFDDVLSAVRHAGLEQLDAVGREETRGFWASVCNRPCARHRCPCMGGSSQS